MALTSVKLMREFDLRIPYLRVMLCYGEVRFQLATSNYPLNSLISIPSPALMLANTLLTRGSLALNAGFGRAVHPAFVLVAFISR